MTIAKRFVAMLAMITGFAKVNLAFHADAGTLTNVSVSGTSGSYAVNSYTGEAAAADSNYSLADELKDYYDTQLLENSRIDMIYAQFAKRQQLPKGHNGKVEWRKWNTFKRAGKLQEGVIPTGQKFGATKVTGTIDQYGTYVTISDVLELHSYDDIIDGATVEMGASMAETEEALTRDALYTGTNVVYCDKITRADGTETEVTDETGLVEDTTYHCHLTPKMVNKVATKMKKAKVPQIGGRFVAVVNPSVAFDIRQSDEWTEVHKYDATRQIFNGEIGELHGVRFIEDTFAPVIKGAPLDDGTNGYLTVKTAIEAATKNVVVNETLVADALIGRMVLIGGTQYEITDNTTDTIVLDENISSAAVNAKIYPGEGGAAGIAIYATYFFGRDSFGIIDPEGGAAQMIVKSKKEIGGPLEQFSTIGYKLETNGATILYNERMVRCMSTSEYSDVDEAN